jgi:hypothetical protein
MALTDIEFQTYTGRPIRFWTSWPIYSIGSILMDYVLLPYRSRAMLWHTWFVLFIWLIWFIWLVSFNQNTRQTRRTKQRSSYAGGLFQHPATTKEMFHGAPMSAGYEQTDQGRLSSLH